MAAVDDFVAWAKAQSPGAILKKLETSSFSGASLSGAIEAANALASVPFDGTVTTDEANAMSKRNAVAAKALAATGVLAPAAALVAVFTNSDILKAFGEANYAFTHLDFNGPHITCSAASGAPPGPTSPLTDPFQLHDIAPPLRSLASLEIPVLCQAFFDVEQCWELVPGSMSWAAVASNIAIASIAHLWNQLAPGPRIDYFVPYVPCSGMAYQTALSDITGGVKVVDPLTQGWGGWNGKGLRNSDMGPWDRPPPFVVANQGQYAFMPLSQVPAGAANLSTEFKNVDRGVWNGDQSWPQPGWPWSRISCNAGPLPTALQATMVMGAKVAAAAGVLAVAAPFLAKWLTGKSIEAIIAEILP